MDFAMRRRRPSPPQTIGPFFHDCLMRSHSRAPAARGFDSDLKRLQVQGRVTDGRGEPVDDAMLEIWHVEAGERGPASSQRGYFDRVATHDDGYYSFEIVVPGLEPGDGQANVAHFDVQIFARGLLDRLVTRIYVGDGDVVARDEFLSTLPDVRAQTLVARRVAGSRTTFQLDIHLQGPRETVFFDV